MRKGIVLSLLVLLLTVACVQQPESLTQERFNESLVSAFNSQTDVPEVVNGTLIFHKGESQLSLRNGWLMFVTPSAPFIAAGLEAGDSPRINDYIFHNENAQQLMVSLSAAQTMDFQYIEAPAIADRLYSATQREESPFTLTYDANSITLDDGVLMLKWTNSHVDFGVHKEILEQAGVIINEELLSAGFEMHGNYLIAK